MGTTRRIKIRLEKYERTIIRLGSARQLLCDFCRAETPHLAVWQAAAVLEISEMNVFRLAESERIHSLETAEGKLMICANSFEAEK
jgi:hypothetical protein